MPGYLPAYVDVSTNFHQKGHKMTSLLGLVQIHSHLALHPTCTEATTASSSLLSVTTAMFLHGPEVTFS